MTDEKYEAFKKWFTNNKFKAKKDHNWYDPAILFKEFEDEHETKKREKEIKQILAHSIYGKDYYYTTVGEQEEVRNIYNRLNEGGYLKCQTN